MFAPRRVPPCFTASVDASYSCMNEMGPARHAGGGAHHASRARRRENEKPVPPPLWWMSAMERSVS
jgi:hypothetical protein